MEPREPYRPPQADLTAPGPSTAAGQITPGMVQALDKTRPWVRFLGIMAMIGCGFAVLAGLAMMVVGAFGGFNQDLWPIGGVGLGAVYLLLAFFYFFPGLHLLRYGGAIKRMGGVGDTSATSAMEEALRHQTSFWRFVGIFTAAILGLYVVAIVVAIIFGVIAAAL